MKEQTKTYIAIVLDNSGSMSSLRSDVVDSFNDTVRTIREEAEKQDTRVSFFLFGSFIDQVFHDANPRTLAPLTVSDYRANGSSTRLRDAVGRAIQTLDRVHDSHKASFLVIVLTDGDENASQDYSQRDIATIIRAKQKTDRWTFAFQVPPGARSSIMEQFGVPVDNIREWEATSRGVIETTLATRSGTQSFYAARSAGAMSVQSFYAQPNLSNLKTQDVKANLTDIAKRFMTATVPAEMPIREFVEGEFGVRYQTGSAFYQLTKPEKVQASKEILLMEKGKRSIWGGTEARNLIGLPYGAEAHVIPGNHANYDIFVQSTSTNRKLVRGTKLLVQKAGF